MAGKDTYSTIIKYVVTAVCTQPLHFGSAVGDKGEVLVHPVDHVPFIQASSISGVFRDYCKKMYDAKGNELSNQLFGSEHFEQNTNAFEYGSKIRFSDGMILTKKEGNYTGLTMELRPRVSIDEATGTCKSNEVLGSNLKAGNKFNMEYIGTGTKLQFVMYLYDEQFDSVVKDIISAINTENLQFGGQKSNGCGYMAVEKLLYKKFDLKNKAERMLWYREDELSEKDYTDITKQMNKASASTYAYKITVEGKTENRLLVKSLAVTEYGKDAPKAVNMQNAESEYIVPGSSFKGAVRSQMSKIAAYLQHNHKLQADIIGQTFGTKGESHDDTKAGNIRFFDTVVGTKTDNDMAALSHRIHIDKFTGGVMSGSLFSEKNISGDMKFRIGILDKNNPKQSCAVLIMALRDLAMGMMNVGGGFSVGKGFISVDKIVIEKSSTNQNAVIFVKEKRIEDANAIIKECLASLEGEVC